MRNELRALREARGMTQAQLATRVGVSRQTIISIERDRFDPSLPLAFRLAIELETPIEQLFIFDDSRSSASAGSGSR